MWYIELEAKKLPTIGKWVFLMKSQNISESSSSPLQLLFKRKYIYRMLLTETHKYEQY